MVGQRNLQRGVGGFRAGIAEKHVFEPGRRQFGDAACQLERLRMAELERRRVVQRLGLLADRRGNLAAAVAGIAAPHPGGGIEDFAAVGGEVMHILGAGEHPRRTLEGAVCGVRHPEGRQIVRNADGWRGRALV
jgi:hypothetical protein